LRRAKRKGGKTAPYDYAKKKKAGTIRKGGRETFLWPKMETNWLVSTQA